VQVPCGVETTSFLFQPGAGIIGQNWWITGWRTGGPVDRSSTLSRVTIICLQTDFVLSAGHLASYGMGTGVKRMEHEADF
jgi:hypothetical protein